MATDPIFNGPDFMTIFSPQAEAGKQLLFADQPE
jgi:hypothetical protein